MQYNRHFIALSCETKGYEHKGRQPAGRCILEARGSAGKLNCTVQDLKTETLYSVCMIFPYGDGHAGLKLCPLSVDARGKAEARQEFSADNVLGSGFSLDRCVAVAVVATRAAQLSAPLCGYLDAPVAWRNNFTDLTDKSGRHRAVSASSAVPRRPDKAETRGAEAREVTNPAIRSAASDADNPKQSEAAAVGTDGLKSGEATIIETAAAIETAAVETVAMETASIKSDEAAEIVAAANETADLKPTEAAAIETMATEAVDPDAKVVETQEVFKIELPKPQVVGAEMVDFTVDIPLDFMVLETGESIAGGSAVEPSPDSVHISSEGTASESAPASMADLETASVFAETSANKPVQKSISASTAMSESEPPPASAPESMPAPAYESVLDTPPATSPESGYESEPAPIPAYEPSPGCTSNPDHPHEPSHKPSHGAVAPDSTHSAENPNGSKLFNDVATQFHKALEQLGHETSCKAALPEDAERSLRRLLGQNAQIYPFRKQNRPAKWVRVSPSDVAVINSVGLFDGPFVTEAYRQHEHLILGVTTDGGHKLYVVGVPGVYASETRHMAMRLGFTQFKCCDDTKAARGESGYWLMFIHV